MARPLMARLPRLFRTRFWVPWRTSHSCRFEFFRVFFFLIHVENGILCVHIRIASMRRFYWEHTIYLHVKENRKYIPIIPSDLALRLKLISSNYTSLELFFMVPKVFEPLKFYCMSKLHFLICEDTLRYPRQCTRYREFTVNQAIP